MSPAALNLWVFRDGRRHVSGQQLKNALFESLAALSGRRSQEDILRALLRAGELESAVSDSGFCAAALQDLTDLLAEALVELQPLHAFNYRQLLESCEMPESLSTSVPEGFAYYVLHPLAYADVLETLPRLGGEVVVIGIRSIGSTLSAVTAAEARKGRRHVLRMTVRPHGHPYNRKTTFAPQQQEIIRRGLAHRADFLVVDEGPGLSGSSFLSVAEALLGEGVAAEAITLICSHQPDVESFRADDGPRRARRFRWVAVHSIPRRPENAQVYIGGGEWRRSHFADEDSWPPSWTNLERSKYASPRTAPERRLFKFLGLGHYGDEVFERERQVARHGFAPMPQREAHGFASYAWVNGRPMHPNDLTGTVLLRLAEYCAFREQAFAADLPDLNSLQRMADYNLEQMELHFPVALHLERPVIADGRMQPHEWLLSPEGRISKVDSGSHGDDHFFPGPTDIAWDLAGSIIEWQMDAEQADFFLGSYRRISGDDARERVREFVTAYSTFRKAYLLMAANALHGSEEQARLERAAASYELGLKAEVQTTGL